MEEQQITQFNIRCKDKDQALFKKFCATSGMTHPEAFTFVMDAARKAMAEGDETLKVCESFTERSQNLVLAIKGFGAQLKLQSLSLDNAFEQERAERRGKKAALSSKLAALEERLAKARVDWAECEKKADEAEKAKAEAEMRVASLEGLHVTFDSTEARIAEAKTSIAQNCAYVEKVAARRLVLQQEIDELWALVQTEERRKTALGSQVSESCGKVGSLTKELENCKRELEAQGLKAGAK
jgi:chromosome segregation ATPase